MKEFFRKKLVGLKRSPQLIAMLFILVCMVIYTFSIGTFAEATTTLFSDNDKTLLIESGISPILRNPAVFVFISTLLSVLLPISYLSVYKKGKRSNFMFSIVLVMVALLIVCDVLYLLAMNFFTGPDWFLNDFEIQNSSVTTTIIHLISLGVTLLAILTKPLYGALLNKIDTSVEDEYDKLMDQKSDEELLIDLEDEN